VKARILVTLKKDVLDPQGKAIQHAARTLGFAGVTDVRQGKLFEITLDAPDERAALELLDELGRKLLANPVIEDYAVEAVER
jgi:phosphoribosylformylglycinamidine synthase